MTDFPIGAGVFFLRRMLSANLIRYNPNDDVMGLALGFQQREATKGMIKSFLINTSFAKQTRQETWLDELILLLYCNIIFTEFCKSESISLLQIPITVQETMEDLFCASCPIHICPEQWATLHFMSLKNRTRYICIHKGDYHKIINKWKVDKYI